MCDIALEDIGGESCEPVGGMVSTALICPVKDFTDLKQPPDSLEGALETLATIVGPHVAAEGKGFTKMEGVEKATTIKSTMVGEEGRRLYQNESQITIAGSSKKLLGFLRVAKNLRFISLLEEAGTGQQRQLGSRQQPARFTGIEHAIEATMEGANSVVLTIQDTQKYPAPVYEGDIPMKAGAPAPPEGNG